MSIGLAVQKSLYQRLTGSPAVTALVPSGNVLDVNQRPMPDPAVIMGEGQVLDDGDDIARKRWRVVHDLHCWKIGKGLGGANMIAGAVAQAIDAGRLALEEGYDCVDVRASSVRLMRDPDGETGHAVVTVETIVQVTA